MVKNFFESQGFQFVKNFQRWALLVEDIGLHEVRKIPGYHDEPLQGDRQGERSTRLSKAYRVIYTETPD